VEVTITQYMQVTGQCDATPVVTSTQVTEPLETPFRCRLGVHVTPDLSGPRLTSPTVKLTVR
jgi:hypothetical protein